MCPKLQKGDKIPHFTLNETEVKVYLDSISVLRDRGIAIMGLYVGLRISEIVNCQWHWVNFEMGQINVSDNDRPLKYSPKYHSKRTLYPQSEVFDFLRMYQINVKTQNYIFASNRSDTQYRMSKQHAISLLNQYALNLPENPETPHFGKTIGSHTLRRTYASTVFNKCVKDGKSIDEALLTVKRLLGHRDVETTRRYLFLASEEQHAKSVANMNLYKDIDLTKNAEK